MRTLITILSLVLTMNAMADIGLQFNHTGEFIPPDEVLLSRGVKSYLDGSKSEAINTLKKSAKFGNEQSKYYIGLIYLENKEWTNGYAWLKLLEKPYNNSEEIIKKYGSVFTKQELKSSQNKLTQLKKQYNIATSLQRRRTWESKIQVIGSHIKGISALSRRNIRLIVGYVDVQVEAVAIKRQVNAYVKNID